MACAKSKKALFGQLLLAVVVLFCLCSPALADRCPLVTVDEEGNGILDFSACSGGIFPLKGVLARDPGPGGLASVLTYDLLGPPSLVAGDVLLQDGVGGPILDVVRFNPRGTGGAGYPASLLFYSDNVDGFDSLGDTPGPPLAFYANRLTILEVGVEGGDGAFYTPLPGQPGHVAGFAVSYNLISDGRVPEPATFLLLGSGLIGLAGGMIRKRRQRAQSPHNTP